MGIPRLICSSLNIKKIGRTSVILLVTFTNLTNENLRNAYEGNPTGALGGKAAKVSLNKVRRESSKPLPSSGLL